MAEPDPEKEIEVAYELPDGWMWVRLSDVINDFQPGFACGARDDRGYVQLRMNNIGLDGRVVLEKTLKVPIEKTNMEKYNLRMGDILFNNTNSVELIGKTALFRDEVQKCVFSNHITRIRSDTRLINSKYLLNVFINGYNRGIFQMMCHRFVGQAGISRKKLLEHTFPLPPLHEQHRIVTKLETLLAQVNRSKDHLAKVPPLIKRFRQSVLAAACSGRLTEDWRREHPDVEQASELLNRIREERIQRYDEECRKAEAEGRRQSKKPKNIELKKYETNEMNAVPINWAFVNLDFISTKVTDGEHLRPNVAPKGIPFLSAKDVRDDAISFENPLYVSKADSMKFRARCNPEKGDILIVSRGATVGRTCIVNTVKEFCLLGSVILIKVVDSVLSKYVLFTVKSLEVQKKLDDMSGSTAQQAIYLKDVKKLDFFLPPLPEQHEIVKRLETLFHFADEVEQRVAAATDHTNHLTQSILARAFLGELVPQDPHDEPASVLLEQIKQERAKNGM